MAHENSIRRYRHWYAKLLRLYSKSYYERFGEGMEQTFSDLLRERAEEGRGILGSAVWMFLETSAVIIRENMTFIIMQNMTKRLSVWAAVVALILLIPLVLTLINPHASVKGGQGGGWDWTLFDFVIMGGALFGVGLSYELIARRSEKTVYRVAFGVGLAGAFLLFWVNGAVGIIGSEDNPANLMYGAVFAVGLIGSLIARFKPRGMARTLFAAAFAQMLVPVIALIVWRPDFSPGVAKVFVLNAFFAMLFVGSALLFQRASATGSKQTQDQS